MRGHDRDESGAWRITELIGVITRVRPADAVARAERCSAGRLPVTVRARRDWGPKRQHRQSSTWARVGGEAEREASRRARWWGLCKYEEQRSM